MLPDYPSTVEWGTTQDCITRILKPISPLCAAHYCRALRRQWCSGGVDWCSSCVRTSRLWLESCAAACFGRSLWCGAIAARESVGTIAHTLCTP